MSSDLIFVIDIVELIFCDKAKFQEITQKEVMINSISWEFELHEYVQYSPIILKARNIQMKTF